MWPRQCGAQQVGLNQTGTLPNLLRLPVTLRCGTWWALLFALLAITLTFAGCTPDPVPGTPLPQSRIIGGPGMEPGRFARPRCIDADATTLWIIDRAAKVQRFDPATGLCIQWFVMPESQLGKPTGITVAPSPAGDGSLCLYLADTHYSRIVVYQIPPLPDGFVPGDTALLPQRVTPTEVLRFGTYGHGDGQMIYPTDVAVITLADGKTVDRIYVTEYGGHDRVNCFDAKGAFRFAFGTFGVPTTGDAADSSFNRPQSIAVLHTPKQGKTSDTEANQLLITDSVNGRLGLFSLDGQPLRWLTASTLPNGTTLPFSHPRGIATLPDQTVLIVEFGANRVQHINPLTGACLGVWGRGGRGTGDLAEPWDLARIGKTSFIVDASNHRIVVADIP